jgi:hypothetical protein
MANRFVTVQMFNNSFKAQLAKNLLENEGIESMMSGELSQDVMLGTGLNQIALQVHEDQAQRATGILAAAEAEAELDADWEHQAESGAGVWVCTICGEPIHNSLSVCYSCQTPREGIRASAPRENTAIQHDPATLPTGEEVLKRDEITHAPAPAITAAPTPVTTDLEAGYELPPATLRADLLARRAFFAALIGAGTICFLPLSWYFLLEAVSFDGPRSPRGNRHLYTALAINALCLLVPLLLCVGLRV